MPLRVFIGMETSGQLRRRFQQAGCDVRSCDLLPCVDEAGPEHIVGEVFETLDDLWGKGWWPDVAVFHPDCTYLTGAAEWAFKDPDFDRYPNVGYHQRLKPGTLFGLARRNARTEALEIVRRIFALKIKRKIVENPVGAISKAIRPASQIVQPYELGDDASKKTCLWFLDQNGDPLPELMLPIEPSVRAPGRMVEWPRGSGRMVERWSNQTDANQNRMPPSENRWQARSATFPGIADAIVSACLALSH